MSPASDSPNDSSRKHPPQKPYFSFSSFLIIALIVVGGLILLRSKPFVDGTRGGLAVGEQMPVLEAAGWVNGPAPETEGKVVVIDAWATWCGPCRQAAPEMVKTYEKFADHEDLVFVGLTSEDKSALPAIEQFVEQTGITWANGYGAEKTLSELQVTYIPAIWVVDRSGKVVWNYSSSGKLENAIEKALKK